ncbi:MAG TPA: sel1 repeat family protein, partial [Hellea balneolensis]|nr:sel1 repeat family protein [Hellea balneolensis]
MFINGTVKIGKLIACLALLWCMCIPALPGIAQDMHTPSPAHMSADDAESLFLQGKQYHDGRGVSQNYTTARTYYLQAAKLGHNGARLNLGYLYFTGQGVPQSYPTARMWYEQAAAAGDKDAVLNLAMMNQNGLGIPHTIPSTQASPDPLETISSTTSPTDIELMDPESTDTESTDTELMDT